MTQILLPLFLLLNTVLPQTALAAPNVLFVSDTTVNDLPLSTSTIESLVGFYSMYWQVSTSTLNGVIACESNFNQYAHNDNPKTGDDSYGIVQINKIHGEHSDISITQAESAVWSINYLAQQISEGNGDQWSCYRKKASQSP